VLQEIIDAVAEAEGVEPADLDTVLEHYVDTDTIESLARHNSDSWRLEFELPNHTVRVTGQGDVFVDGIPKRALA
jgi:molybdenum cofactor biosynthesis enzyme MoaA